MNKQRKPTRPARSPAPPATFDAFLQLELLPEDALALAFTIYLAHQHTENVPEFL